MKAENINLGFELCVILAWLVYIVFIPFYFVWSVFWNVVGGIIECCVDVWQMGVKTKNKIQFERKKMKLSAMCSDSSEDEDAQRHDS